MNSRTTKHLGVSKTARIHTYKHGRKITWLLAGAHQAERKQHGLEQRSRQLQGMYAHSISLTLS